MIGAMGIGAMLLLSADARGVELPADLTIQIISANKGTLPGGPTATFQVVVTNNGGTTAQAVPIRVLFMGGAWQPPPGAPVGENCTTAVPYPTALEVTCAHGAIGPGLTDALTLIVKTPTGPGGLRNLPVEATVDPANVVSESDETNNVVRIRVPVEVPTVADLTLDLSDMPLTATTGQQLLYEVVVRNDGDRIAVNPTVRLSLPREVDFLRTGTGNQFTQCVAPGPAGPQGQQVVCSRSALFPGRTATLRVLARPINGLPDGAQMVYSVGVDPENTIAERNEFNNVGGGITTVRSPADLAIAGIQIDDQQSPSNGQLGFEAQSCLPEGTSHANTVVRVRVVNNGPGQSPATTLAMLWIRAIQSDFFSDCPLDTHCDNGVCHTGEVTLPQPCFRDCPVPPLFPGSEAEVVFRVVRDHDRVDFGRALLDNARVVNDPNRQNNTARIR